MTDQEKEDLIIEFIRWEDGEWGVNSKDELNRKYVKTFLLFKKLIENCKHEWRNYGKHRLICDKCRHIKML